MEFEGEIWKTGTGHVITIPSRYIKDGNIDPEKKYKIKIKKIKEEEE